VIESRAATDLGQNVKLLTYVSIFYMPVGICAAIWSINADYGLEAFAIVTAVVAVTTYVLVVNLNNIVDASRGLYRVVEKWLVDDMIHRSKDEHWQIKGREFSQFRPKRDNVMPSKWYILRYVILRNFRLFIRETAAQENHGSEDDEPQESPPVAAGGLDPARQDDEGDESPEVHMAGKKKKQFLMRWRQLSREGKGKGKGKDVELGPPAS
jgi:hypothetical protein